MRAGWIARRQGQGNVTQLHFARQGIVTEEMAHVAAGERLAPELVRAEVARGRMVIPANVRHPELHPLAIGVAATCKINANIGNGAVTSKIEDELAKLAVCLKHGADTVSRRRPGRWRSERTPRIQRRWRRRRRRPPIFTGE